MLSIIKVPNHIAGFGTVILRDLFSIYIQSIPIFRLEFLFKSLKFLMKSLLHRFFRVIAAHHPVHTLGIDFGNAELTICFLHCLQRRVVKFKDIYIRHLHHKGSGRRHNDELRKVLESFHHL